MTIEELLSEQSRWLRLIDTKICCLSTAINNVGLGGESGPGTVTTLSVVTANGISGVVANPTTTPAITLTLGAITPTTVKGLTISTTTGTFTLTNAKVFAVTNSLTLSGTDSTTMTFPTTSKTLAANDGSNWTISSQAIGDILSATSTTAYGRLAAVATGSVLVSQGTGTAPAYSANPQVTTIELGNASDTTLSRSSGGVLAVEGAVVATLSTAQTWTATQTEKQVIFTNNAITAVANAATVPITHRFQTVTNNSAATLTITITTASAVNGQLLLLQILDFSAAAQTLTFVNTENSTTSVPAISNGSTTLPLTIGFIFNGLTSKWRCIANS